MCKSWPCMMPDERWCEDDIGVMEPSRSCSDDFVERLKSFFIVVEAAARAPLEILPVLPVVPEAPVLPVVPVEPGEAVDGEDAGAGLGRKLELEFEHARDGRASCGRGPGGPRRC